LVEFSLDLQIAIQNILEYEGDVETDMFMSYQISVGEYGKIKTVDLKVRHKREVSRELKRLNRFETPAYVFICKKYNLFRYFKFFLQIRDMPRDRFSKLCF
jgi:hypothetical protein